MAPWNKELKMDEFKYNPKKKEDDVQIRTHEYQGETWYHIGDTARRFGFNYGQNLSGKMSPANIRKIEIEVRKGQLAKVNFATITGLFEAAKADWHKPHLRQAADDLNDWITEELSASGAALGDGPGNYIAGEMTDEEKADAEKKAKDRYGYITKSEAEEILNLRYGLADFDNQNVQHHNPKENMTTAAPASQSTQIFNFEGHNVRTVLIDNEPWFVLSDVCKVLEIGNPSDVKRRLSSEDVNTVDTIEGKGNPRKTIVNESGLYSVIFMSRKPQAKSFKRWVTSEVLPAIRKHGGYLTPEAVEKTLTDPDFIIGLAQALKDEQTKSRQLEKQNKSLEADNKKLKPKADNYDAWIDGKGVFLLGNVAKLLDEGRNIIGQNRLFKFLREEGILISGGQRHNIPQQKYMKHFKVKTRVMKTLSGEERVSMTTYVKPSGVEFIAQRLRDAGYKI